MKTSTILSLIKHHQEVQRVNPMESEKWQRASKEIPILLGMMEAKRVNVVRDSLLWKRAWAMLGARVGSLDYWQLLEAFRGGVMVEVTFRLRAGDPGNGTGSNRIERVTILDN